MNPSLGPGLLRDEDTAEGQGRRSVTLLSGLSVPSPFVHGVLGSVLTLSVLVPL